MADQNFAEPASSTRDAHGAFIWYELLTSDPDAAARFYEAIVGWSVRNFEGDGTPDYRIFHASDGDGIAGLMALPAEAAARGARPGWLGYVGVDDVDRTVADARDAGATVHMPPADLPGVGRMAMIADPQGAPLYVMRGASDQASTSFSPTAAGHCSWNELATDDPAAAIDFHKRLFGWTEGESMPMGEMGDYQMLDHGGRSFGAVMRRMPDAPVSAWTFYFRVPAIDEAAARVGPAGGTVLFGPSEIPGGEFILTGVDPQGAVFALVGPR
jgi:predicted enzyme related to lactoylglutathione lyase